eukprot:1041155-Pelagomonas_calceolata.AAC.2
MRRFKVLMLRSDPHCTTFCAGSSSGRLSTPQGARQSCSRCWNPAPVSCSRSPATSRTSGTYACGFNT